ncbi:hypothetical protein BCR36DRAFT_306023, partial [Piromyces finnis]
DINCTNNYGHTPLHELYYNTCNKELLPILIENGALINKRNNKGEIPIFIIYKY